MSDKKKTKIIDIKDFMKPNNNLTGKSFNHGIAFKRRWEEFQNGINANVESFRKLLSTTDGPEGNFLKQFIADLIIKSRKYKSINENDIRLLEKDIALYCFDNGVDIYKQNDFVQMFCLYSYLKDRTIEVLNKLFTYKKDLDLMQEPVFSNATRINMFIYSPKTFVNNSSKNATFVLLNYPEFKERIKGLNDA